MEPPATNPEPGEPSPANFNQHPIDQLPSANSSGSEELHLANPALNEPSSMITPPSSLPASTAVTPSFSIGNELPQNPIVTGVTHPSLPMHVEKKPKKKLLLVGVLALVILLGSGGAVFGYYLPSKPNAVWGTAVGRSGKALNQLIDKATEKSKLETFKKSDITISLDSSFNEHSYSGTFEAKFDASKSDEGLNFVEKQTGKPDQAANVKILSEVPAGGQFPNIYFQLNGLKLLGLDDFIPGITDYDGKWIAVEAQYLQSFGNIPTAQQTTRKQLTSDDFAELARAGTSTTVDYVFTTDPNKAVFEKKSFVAKEKVDGVSTYHYTVGLNSEHAKAYCMALVDKVYSTNAYKKLPWVNENYINQDKATAERNCSSGDNQKDTNSYDVWVDAKYKLIYKIRMTDSSGKDTYFEVGQNYKGGDDVSLFLGYHSGPDKMDGKLTLDTSLTSSTTTGSLEFSATGEIPFSLKLSIQAKPYTGDITVNKPAGAIPIKDVFARFGIDPNALLNLFYLYRDSSASSAPGGSLDDTERQTDINALASHTEAFYASYGYYPTLANINDATWRSNNVKGLDKEALKDPTGSSYTVVAKPAKSLYAYAVTAADGSACDNVTKDCVNYTYTATLDSGTTYVKHSFN